MKFKTAVFLFKATFIFRCIKRSAFVVPKEKNRCIGQSLAKLIVLVKFLVTLQNACSSYNLRTIMSDWIYILFIIFIVTTRQ